LSLLASNGDLRAVRGSLHVALASHCKLQAGLNLYAEGDEVAEDEPPSVEPTLREVAYLHEPYWYAGESDWVKSLLLFFEGIAILVPDYMWDRPLESDPSLAAPLSDLGLLTRLRPESLVDRSVAGDLAELLDGLMRRGAFSKLNQEEGFADISLSRLGWDGDPTLSEYIIEELKARGLAKKTRGDGVSIPLQRELRTLVLITLPQLFRLRAEQAGLSLQPATRDSRSIKALRDLLNSPAMPTQGNVVVADLEQVCVDLSSVPLDDVLAFRTDHGEEYRSYARELRRFMREMAATPAAEQSEALLDRREAIADEADRLRRLSRRSMRRPLATFGLGLAGGALNLAMGNPIGAGIAFGSGFLGLQRRSDAGSAYSYLFTIQDRLSR